MPESGERDAAGRWTSDNPGRPPGSVNKTTELRQAMAESVTAKDVRQIVAVLVRQAKRGNVAACKEVLNRVCGKADAALATPAESEDGYQQALRGVFGDGIVAESRDAARLQQNQSDETK